MGVPGTSRRGSHRRYRESYVSLALDMLYCSTRIIGTTRKRIGSGFFITVKSERDEHRWGYLVTADHVLKGHTETWVQAPAPGTAGKLYEPIPVSEWRRGIGGADLAIAPVSWLGDDERRFWAWEVEKTLPIEVATSGPAAGLTPVKTLVSPLLGSTVFYIGLLAPLDRSMARSGTIGAIDQTGVPHSHGHQYPCHLVDCRSYGGFSGSPCFLLLQHPGLSPVTPPFGMTELGPMSVMNYFVVLCGMVTDHLKSDEDDPVSAYGVSVLLRSNEIKEALMSKDFRDERLEWDIARASAEPAKPAEPIMEALGVHPSLPTVALPNQPASGPEG